MESYTHNPYSATDFSKIGHGYRNVCWLPGYRDKLGNKQTGHIVLFGYDTEGNPKTFRFPFCPSVKYEVSQRTTAIDLFGKHIETRYFDDTNDRREWCEQMERAFEKSNKRIISCYNPEQEFLLNVFHKYVVGKELDENFNQQTIRTHYIDIEVAVENSFPEPEQAEFPINLITIYDSKEKKFYSWALNTEIKNTITEFPVELRKFDSEEDLLHDYLEWHVANYPDIIVGWNTKFFDVIYVVNRMEKILGKKETKRLSPVGKYRSNIEDKKNFGKKFAQIKGISSIDLLFLYRDKFQIKQALDGGYGLNNVSNEELEDAKLKVYEVEVENIKWTVSEKTNTENLPQKASITIKCYNELEVDSAIRSYMNGNYGKGNYAEILTFDYHESQQDASMLNFYKSHFQEFWEYNVQDVNLVVKLEDKLKLLSIVRKITTFGCAPLESIYTTISYIISSLDIYARNEYNKVFLSYANSKSRGADSDKYEGAFVFPTQAGIYKQGIAGIDFNSLYPSTSRVLNISPETLVGMLVENDISLNPEKSPFTIIYANGERVDVAKDAVDEILEKACIKARNNALFYKHEVKQGIFANWCGNFFKMRKGYKKLLAQCEKNLLEMKSKNTDSNSEKIKELEILAEYYNATQYALKILINSAYGTLGTTYSPIYDVRLAEAITLSGQFANRSTSKYLNDLFKKEYNAAEDFNITISGDTDSVTGDMILDVIIDEGAIANGKGKHV